MIAKELKNSTFIYDEDKKEILITDKNAPHTRSTVVLSRIGMFSLARFILRIAQKGPPKKKKKGEADGQKKLFNRTGRRFSSKRR